MKIWVTFNNCCQKLYGIGAYATIAEKRQKLRHRCRFRQCIPREPWRYGMKYWIIADAENHYCYNVIPYLDQESDAPSFNLGAHVVKNLVEPIKGSNHDITCDRYKCISKELYKYNITEAVAQRCSVKRVFLKKLQNSKENNCVRVSFLTKL